MTDRYSIEAKMESNLKVLYRYDLPKVRKVRNDTNVTNIRNDTNKVYPDETMRCENNHTKLPEKTIIIVPYRSRLNNLKLFLSPLHKHLMNQVRIKYFHLNINKYNSIVALSNKRFVYFA